MSNKTNSLDGKKIESQFIKLISKPTNYYIKKILEKNKKFDFKKPVVLFGAAKMGIIYADLCKKNKIKVLAFGDNDKLKHGILIKNIKVGSIDDLKNKYGGDVQIIITSLYDEEIKEQLNKLGFKNVWSHTFFSTLFAKKFSVLAWTNYINSINSNRLKLIELFEILGDIKSKKVFLNIIKFRLTLDRKHLKSAADDIRDIYFDDSVYKLSKNETFVDVGAFDGDTVKLFIDVNNNKFKKIYCFEPDNKSYLDLKKFVSKKNDKRIEIFKYGLGLKSETVYFSNDGGLGSKVSNSGDKIEIKNMDSILKDKITLIKMDIEGCEQNALIGSKETILKYKPKLAICVYHNLADLWEIPLLIKNIRPDYKIYLRHYNQFLFDTVCYAV
ncbi:MAG: FkbM family methyltransferase [Candidatus Shapirobacteria bacterium]|nr:FkbM family methyltransferase [Candidatus Shapirobacteria bacterium]